MTNNTSRAVLEPSQMFTRNLERTGAIALLFGAAGFILIFFYLHSTFGYPEILSGGAADVLPRLADGGSTLHHVWLLYAALPLTLFVAGIASMPLLEDGGGRGLARLGAAAATLAAVAMMIGLLRWPSIHDVLAARWPTASTDQRETYAAIFDATNRYLGNLLGELLGELALAGWFACVGFALHRSERRAGGTLVLGAAAIVAISALRQLTSVVAPVAALGNVVLPLGLLVIAGYMLRLRPSVRAARARALRWTAIVTVLIALVASHAPAAAESSVAVEADAAAFALGGYSLSVRASRSSGLDFAVGTGRYRLPSLFLKGQDSYDEAGWRATSEAIQVARVGYRWRGPHANGPTVGAIVLNQLWHLEASKTGGATRFKTLGIGVNTGYYIHLGGHFYLYPTASITLEHEYSGASRVGDLDYVVSRLGYAASLHVGWEL